MAPTFSSVNLPRQGNRKTKMGPNQTCKLFSSKGNHKQNEKRTYRMGEKICKQCNQQWINPQNIQTDYTAQIKNQTTQSKTGQEI